MQTHLLRSDSDLFIMRVLKRRLIQIPFTHFDLSEVRVVNLDRFSVTYDKQFFLYNIQVL